MPTKVGDSPTQRFTFKNELPCFGLFFFFFLTNRCTPQRAHVWAHMQSHTHAYPPQRVMQVTSSSQQLWPHHSHILSSPSGTVNPEKFPQEAFEKRHLDACSFHRGGSASHYCSLFPWMSGWAGSAKYFFNFMTFTTCPMQGLWGSHLKGHPEGINSRKASPKVASDPPVSIR